MKIRWLCPAVFAATVLAGCGSNSPLAEDLKRYTTSPEDHAAQSPEPFAEARRVRIRALHNTPYVSLQEIMTTTSLRGARLPDGSFGVGDHDPIWSFQAGERKVTVDGMQRELAAPAVQERGELYIPLSALQSLFGDVAIFKVESRHVEFYPRTTDERKGADRGNAQFSDAVSAKSTDADSMIAYAKKFLGDKYDFGAGSYAQSGKFDCSSYVQHVFGHFGIDMPRTAREQAQGGTPVGSSSLIPGDLLFFNVPGKFKSRQAVGHVGIYMGVGNMIHASPAGDNGVQMTQVNSRYWQSNFLHARRYVQ